MRHQQCRDSTFRVLPQLGFRRVVGPSSVDVGSRSRRGGCEMPAYDLGLTVERLSRAAGACVLAVSGEFSLRSAGLVEDRLNKALADTGRVLVDVSGLRVTWPPVVGVFPSTLARAGGWP